MRIARTCSVSCRPHFLEQLCEEKRGSETKRVLNLLGISFPTSWRKGREGDCDCRVPVPGADCRVPIVGCRLPLAANASRTDLLRWAAFHLTHPSAESKPTFMGRAAEDFFRSDPQVTAGPSSAPSIPAICLLDSCGDSVCYWRIPGPRRNRKSGQRSGANARQVFSGHSLQSDPPYPIAPLGNRRSVRRWQSQAGGAGHLGACRGRNVDGGILDLHFRIAGVEVRAGVHGVTSGAGEMLRGPTTSEPLGRSRRHSELAESLGHTKRGPQQTRTNPVSGRSWPNPQKTRPATEHKKHYRTLQIGRLGDTVHSY